MQEDYDWIIKVLGTCTNTFHFSCIDNLIDLYNTKHTDCGKELSIQLLYEREIKYKLVHGILT